MLTFPPFQSFDFRHSRKPTKTVSGMRRSRAGKNVTHKKIKSKNKRCSKKLLYINTSSGEGRHKAEVLNTA
jgi:hypothetical protein